jgi:hypothetical protein
VRHVDDHVLATTEALVCADEQRRITRERACGTRRRQHFGGERFGYGSNLVRFAVRQDDDRHPRVAIPPRGRREAEAAAVMSDVLEPVGVLTDEESHRVAEPRPVVECRRRDHVRVRRRCKHLAAVQRL